MAAFKIYFMQINLDVFGGQASNTIRNNMGEVNKHIKFGIELGLEGMFLTRGPSHVKYDVGMKEAVLHLMGTHDKKRYNKFVQHSTARKFRSSFRTFGIHHHSLHMVQYWQEIPASCLFPITLCVACFWGNVYQVCTVEREIL